MSKYFHSIFKFDFDAKLEAMNKSAKNVCNIFVMFLHPVFLISFHKSFKIFHFDFWAENFDF
jgi:hypothetical protein